MSIDRILTIGVITVSLASCRGTAAPDPNARPASPNALPVRSANLQLTGPVTAHVDEVRLSQCASRKDGDYTSFYASIYFSTNGRWYYLQLIGLDPLPLKGAPSGYAGPGLYAAEADFREMIVNPGAMTSGTRAWGVRPGQMATLRVSSGAATVTVGSGDSWSPRPITSGELSLWPKSPDQSGPKPDPTPSADQIEHISGSWSCR